MKRHIGSILVGIAIVVILLLNWVTFTVRWQEQALVLTFGKISHIETQPGLKWMWPWQEVVKFDQRIRTYMPAALEVQTRDQQTVICRVYVNWRIDDINTFYNRFKKPGMNQDDVIEVAKVEGLRNWLSEATNAFAAYDLGDLVTLDRDRFKLEMVEHSADGTGGMLGLIRDKEREGGGYGIEIVDVGIRQLGVPDQVTQSVFNRMKEERQAVIRTLIADGTSQKTAIVARARGEATEIEARANAEAKAIMGQGDAEAAKYYAEFLDNPQLAKFLRNLDTLRRTLTNRTTVVLDTEMPAYRMLTTGPEMITSTETAEKSQNK